MSLFGHGTTVDPNSVAPATPLGPSENGKGDGKSSGPVSTDAYGGVEEMSFMNWLMTVDTTSKPEFITKVMKLLAGEGIEIESACDLNKACAEQICNAVGTTVSSKVQSFISRAVEAATLQGSIVLKGRFEGARVEEAPVTISNGDRMSDVLCELLGKKKHTAKKVHVVLAPLLKDINLQGLAKHAWPQAWAMDASASEGVRLLTKLVDAGSDAKTQPFIFNDLQDFEPLWIKTKVELEEARQEQEAECAQTQGFQALAGALGARSKAKQRQSIPKWNAAIDKWAIYAAARGQINYAKALEHKELCQKIAYRAPLHDRRASLGVIYDVIARKQWAVWSMQDPSFNVNDVAGIKDPDTLYEAEVQFDSEFKSTTNQDAQKGWQAGMAVAPTCYKCGKVCVY